MSQSIRERTDVFVRNRITGEILTETIHYESALRWIYENPLGFALFTFLFNNAFLCNLYGKLQDLPFSSRKISAFIEQYTINTDEIELPLEKYHSFNAFFSRKLKSNARPFETNPNIFCSPADGKVLVYPQLEDGTEIPVKGVSFSVDSLLQSHESSQIFKGGSSLIIRLAPYDYHRFHFPDDGMAEMTIDMAGSYHSVNPIAIAKVPDLFCLNKRAVTNCRTKHFGNIAYIEIGAIMVGSIVQTFLPGAINRGEEKGYFRYGGSTIVLLFEPGAVIFDEDLVQDSKAGVEVQVKAGSRLGEKGR